MFLNFIDSLETGAKTVYNTGDLHDKLIIDFKYFLGLTLGFFAFANGFKLSGASAVSFVSSIKETIFEDNSLKSLTITKETIIILLLQS